MIGFKFFKCLLNCLINLLQGGVKVRVKIGVGGQKWGEGVGTEGNKNKKIKQYVKQHFTKKNPRKFILKLSKIKVLTIRPQNAQNTSLYNENCPRIH